MCQIPAKPGKPDYKNKHTEFDSWSFLSQIYCKITIINLFSKINSNHLFNFSPKRSYIPVPPNHNWLIKPCGLSYDIELKTVRITWTTSILKWKCRQKIGWIINRLEMHYFNRCGNVQLSNLFSNRNDWCIHLVHFCKVVWCSMQYTSRKLIITPPL